MNSKLYVYTIKYNKNKWISGFILYDSFNEGVSFAIISHFEHELHTKNYTKWFFYINLFATYTLWGKLHKCCKELIRMKWCDIGWSGLMLYTHLCSTDEETDTAISLALISLDSGADLNPCS